jgi:hypothetical protein
MRHDTCALSPRPQGVQFDWDKENLGTAFGHSLARLYTSLVLAGLSSVAAVVYAFLAAAVR